MRHGLAISITPFASEQPDEDALDREPEHHAREHADDNHTRKYLETQLKCAEAECKYLRARLAGNEEQARKFNREMAKHDRALTKLRGLKHDTGGEQDDESE